MSEKQGNLRERLWRCAACGLLDKTDAVALDHAAELLRTVEHVVRLVVGRARKWLPATEHALQVTERLCGRILGRAFPEGLDAELLRSGEQCVVSTTGFSGAPEAAACGTLPEARHTCL